MLPDVFACLSPAQFLIQMLSEQVFSTQGEVIISEVYNQYSLTQPGRPLGHMAAGFAAIC